MERDEARRLLGLDESASATQRRAAYRRLLREHHPDRHGGSDAAGATTRALIAAYETLEGVEVAEAARARVDREPAETTSGAPDAVAIVGDDTISLHCPADEAFVRLVEVGHVVGDLTYVDRLTGMLEILVRTPDGHALSLVTSLQGRANGCTEVFVTLEPVGVPDIDVPPVAEATALLADRLAAGDWS